MFFCVFGMKQFPFTNHKWKSKMLNWPQSQWYIDCLMPFYRIKPQKCPPGVWDLRKTTNFAESCNTASLSLYSYCDLMWCDLSAKITRLLHKNLKRSSGIHWRHLHTGSHKSMIEKMNIYQTQSQKHTWKIIFTCRRSIRRTAQENNRWMTKESVIIAVSCFIIAASAIIAIFYYIYHLHIFWPKIIFYSIIVTSLLLITVIIAISYCHVSN